MNLTINKFDPSIAIATANEDKGKSYRYWIGSDNKLKQQDASGTITIICDLPPGDWHLLFKGSEATALQKHQILQYSPFFRTAMVGQHDEFVLKLLRANGIHLTPQQDVIFIKNNKQ